MKILFIIFTALFSKIGFKTTVVFSACAVDYYGQSYATRNNPGYNSFSVYQTNSPGNSYTNSINCMVVNTDSISFETPYMMFNGMYTNDSPLDANGKILWLKGTQLMVTRMDSLTSKAAVSTGYGLTETGTVIKVDTSQIMYTTKADAAIAAINANVALKLNKTDTTGRWQPLGFYDRSITNEIQTLSGSGTQTISLSSGGSFIIPTQTTVLTSNQVTTALGFIPIVYSASTGISINTNTITNTLPDRTVSITPSNTLITVSGIYPNFTIGSSMLPDYTATVATTGSVSVFYLTANGTSTAAALYTNVTYANPIVNDVNGNYTFGWSYNAGTKALTVSGRVATNTAVIALLGISVLGSTTPVPGGTVISVLVKGN